MSRHTGGGNKSGRQLEAGRGQKRASQLEGRQCPARVKSQEELEAAAPAVPCHRGRVAVPPCGPCRLPPCRRACHAQSCHRACRAQSCRRATEPPGMMHPTAPAALLTCSKPHLGASVRTSSPLPASLAPPYRGGPSGRCWRACDAAPRSLYSCTGACMRAQLSRPSSCRARDHMHTTCQRPWTALAADSLVAVAPEPVSPAQAVARPRGSSCAMQMRCAARLRRRSRSWPWERPLVQLAASSF